MIMTRIRSYLQNGTFTTCEHLYARDQAKSIEWFLKDYPEHKQCIVVAEYYDPDDPKNKDHFETCKRSGCVHYW